MLYYERDIVKYIKINRLMWFDYVIRMEQERILLKVLKDILMKPEEQAQGKMERCRRVKSAWISK